jgi:putative SOS response-associated peptidase YedK
MAGLWSVWHDKDAEPDAPPLITCAVLTTDALGQLADIHNRMPMLMTSDQWAGWLNPDDEDGAKLLAVPSTDLVESLELRPISALVNNVRNNGPELLARVDPTAEPVEEMLFGEVGG